MRTILARARPQLCRHPRISRSPTWHEQSASTVRNGRSKIAYLQVLVGSAAGRAARRTLDRLQLFCSPGVWGWTRGPYARGGAMFRRLRHRQDRRRPADPEGAWPGTWPIATKVGPEIETPVSRAQIWDRYLRFLDEMLPVAEEAGRDPRRPSPTNPPVEAAAPDPPRSINSHPVLQGGLCGTAVACQPRGALPRMPCRRWPKATSTRPSPSSRGRKSHRLHPFPERPRQGAELHGGLHRRRRHRHGPHPAHPHPPPPHPLGPNGYDGVLIPRSHAGSWNADAPWHAGKAFRDRIHEGADRRGCSEERGTSDVGIFG